jgi:hypothetical protein
VSDSLTEYNERLDERRIATWVPTQHVPGPKFDFSGNAKPFYGSTCIVWIEQESELFRTLCDLQETIREEFGRAGLGGTFTFLEPESFHMTVCDIDASPDPTRIRLDDRIQQVQKAFEQIEKPGKVTALIKGIGLTRTITALVRFDSEPGELDKVLAMERKIKQATGEDAREFTGHISIAYLVQHPGEATDKIKEILLPYRDRVFGEFSFSQLDLTYFGDMNTYVPVLTVDLGDGTVTHHARASERVA